MLLFIYYYLNFCDDKLCVESGLVFTRDVVVVDERVGVEDAWLRLVCLGTGGVAGRGAEHLSCPRPHRVHIP